MVVPQTESVAVSVLAFPRKSAAHLLMNIFSVNIPVIPTISAFFLPSGGVNSFSFLCEFLKHCPPAL